MIRHVDRERLWRVRKRHDHIDAVLEPSASAFDLEFFYNDRLIYRRRYPDSAAAVAASVARLRELERAGWNTHW